MFPRLPGMRRRRWWICGVPNPRMGRRGWSGRATLPLQAVEAQLGESCASRHT